MSSRVSVAGAFRPEGLLHRFTFLEGPILIALASVAPIDSQVASVLVGATCLAGAVAAFRCLRAAAPVPSAAFRGIYALVFFGSIVGIELVSSNGFGLGGFSFALLALSMHFNDQAWRPGDHITSDIWRAAKIRLTHNDEESRSVIPAAFDGKLNMRSPEGEASEHKFRVMVSTPKGDHSEVFDDLTLSSATYDDANQRWVIPVNAEIKVSLEMEFRSAE